MATPSINLFQLNDSTNTTSISGAKLSSSEVASKKLTEHFSNASEERKNSDENLSSTEKLRKQCGIDEYGLTGKDRWKIMQMYEEGYSEQEIQAEIKKMKKRNQVAKQRKIEHKEKIENFKSTVKASNGLTYNEAMTIKEKYLSRYQGVAIVWVGPKDENDPGHYRTVTEDEKIEALKLSKEERAEWDKAKAALAELEPQLAEIEKKHFQKALGFGV